MEAVELKAKLSELIEKDSKNKLAVFMEENTIFFFATPEIPEYYRLLKDVDFTSRENILPKIMLAWMAFLCGDHAGLFVRMEDIRESDLQSAQASSMFYALKALVSSMMDTGEALRYAKLSIEVLPQGDKSFALANGELTYGQILAGTNQYRDAAAHFERSYRLFFTLKLPFLAVVALTNELLNRYKLGEISLVLVKCNEALLMSGSYKDQMQKYWNLIHIPLGICYYELNKPNLAAEHLKLAKSCIDNFELFHMHGMIEQYLFFCYFLLRDTKALDEIKQGTQKQFGHMRFKQMDLLLSMMNIYTAEDLNLERYRPDIEKFELEYSEEDCSPYSIVTDVLFYLKQKGKSELLTTQHLEKRLEYFRFVGNLPKLQSTLIQMTELYQEENRQKDGAVYMKEAVQIYRDSGICAAFFLFPLRTEALLEKLSPKIVLSLEKNGGNSQKQEEAGILSQREREIMKLIALGKTNEEMGKELFISVGTVKWHINHIFSKLEVKNRVQATQKAKALGEIT